MYLRGKEREKREGGEREGEKGVRGERKRRQSAYS